MTPKEQMDFVNELTENVKYEIKKNIANKKTPEEWDGHELREYIAEKFSECRSALMKENRSKRLKEYRNTVLVKNL